MPFLLLFWATADQKRRLCEIWEAGMKQEPLHSEGISHLDMERDTQTYMGMGGGGVQLDLVLLDSLDRSPSRLHADKQRLWPCLMLALDSLRWKLDRKSVV